MGPPPAIAPGPARPVALEEYKAHASRILPKNAYDYYASGANDQITLDENKKAFERLRLLPRVLRDVTEVDCSTTLLGTKVAYPICVAPTAMQRMANDDGEKATARACSGGAGGADPTLMCLSSWSTTSLEDVMDAAPAKGGPKWFQLYVYKSREITLDLVRRAERAGYKALAVTVDTPVLGKRENDIRNQFSLPSHLTMGNFVGHNEVGSGADGPGGNSSGLASYVAAQIDPSLTWDTIRWLKTVTTLPVVLKGIMNPADAILAVEVGADAVWVSNHGARQLDTAPATVEALPVIVRAVREASAARRDGGRRRKCEIYLDGGVTRGTDVFKALALGADAVFVGRPVLWGMAHSGEEGVRHVLQLLRDEFEMALRLTGCLNLDDVHSEGRSMVMHQAAFSRL